jgi:hypothetical protein
MIPEALVPRGRLRSFLLRLPILVGGLAVLATLSRRWPQDQTVEVVLGSAAPEVREVRVRYGDPSDARNDWQREVVFRYGPGQAPRVVHHAPRLASGEYDVQIELVHASGPSATETEAVTRHVRLEGHPVSLDVVSALTARKADDAKPPPTPSGAASARL